MASQLIIPIAQILAEHWLILALGDQMMPMFPQLITTLTLFARLFSEASQEPLLSSHDQPKFTLLCECHGTVTQIHIVSHWILGRWCQHQLGKFNSNDLTYDQEALDRTFWCGVPSSIGWFFEKTDLETTSAVPHSMMNTTIANRWYVISWVCRAWLSDWRIHLAPASAA